jgi:uncharacterized protein YbjQ (UPF0145 family)
MAQKEKIDDILLISIEYMPDGRPIELGELVTVAVVQAGNIVRDFREMITNLLGGRMKRYENLLDATVERGKARFREKLAAEGYDGAVGVRFASPKIVDGGAELIIFGTGFKYLDKS